MAVNEAVWRYTFVFSVLCRFAWFAWLSWLSSYDEKPRLSSLHNSFIFFSYADSWLAGKWDRSSANHALHVLYATTVLFIAPLILPSEVITNGVWNMFDCETLMNGAWPRAYRLVCFSSGFILYNQLSSIERLVDHELYTAVFPTLVEHCLQLICLTFPLYGDVMVNYSVIVIDFMALFELCRRIKVELQFSCRLRLRPVEELPQYRIQGD